MLSARMRIDPLFQVGQVRRRLFGSFVEHMGRCVYEGIYEPGHPTADADGFRADVLELVRELGVTTVRYPGGNFVSGFRWEDSVGPKSERPRRRELAWHSTETNQVGLDEFASWAKKAGTELMYAVNLGTRGIPEAVDVLEYANLPPGTTLADQRVSNGHAEPHAIRMWCLGNEMDGPWQIGHRNADDYGKLASQVAKAMRKIDPDLELVACGSSTAQIPTFGSWEHTVLTHTYEDVDYISCHAYYQEYDGDTGSYLASPVDMDRFIDSVVATADAVGASLKSERTINLSFDEWNVWCMTDFLDGGRITGTENWPIAPRLIEDTYNVVDAVVVGGLLISLLNHADRVHAASLAQLVNVIAPIRTEPGGGAWRQTTYFPFATTSRLAHGTALQVHLDCPTYRTAKYGEVPLVDAAAVWNGDTGELAIFVVNRDLHEDLTITVDVSQAGITRVFSAETLGGADLSARNTLEHPDAVRPAVNESASVCDGSVTVSVPPASWTAVSLGSETER